MPDIRADISIWNRPRPRGPAARRQACLDAFERFAARARETLRAFETASGHAGPERTALLLKVRGEENAALDAYEKVRDELRRECGAMDRHAAPVPVANAGAEPNELARRCAVFLSAAVDRVREAHALIPAAPGALPPGLPAAWAAELRAIRAYQECRRAVFQALSGSPEPPRKRAATA